MESLIYFLEGNPLGAPFHSLFRAFDAGRIQALVTPITVAEVVSGPLKVGNEALAERYCHAITRAAGWALRSIDSDVAMLAARLRLRHTLKLPDALQLAVALHEGCHALVTHDRDSRGVKDLPILGLTPRGGRR